MEMLNTKVEEATRKKFSEEMEEPVSLVHFTQEPSRLIVPDQLKAQDCHFCKETKSLIKDVSALSDKIGLKVFDFTTDRTEVEKYGIDKIPATVITGEKDYGIRFFGIPSGYEYAGFIEAIADVSKRATAIKEGMRTALKKIDAPVHIQVFVTPTCPYCTMAVRTAHQFALESDQIISDMVESTEFPHLAHKYNVAGVPKIIINETTTVEGAVPEETILDHILKALAPKKKE